MATSRFVALIALLLLCLTASAADITGKWTASFETQIGVQNYTYEFKVADGKLTGTTKSQHGGSEISEGSVKGDAVSFVENLKFQDMQLRIVYTGKIVSADEIKFSRQVGDFDPEQLTAKRAK